MNEIVTYKAASTSVAKTLGSCIPTQLAEDTNCAYSRLNEALGNNVAGYVADRLQMTSDQLSVALAAEQVDGVALAIYNIEGRAQSVIIGDQTGIGKGRQAAALIRYGMLAGYFPIFLTDRYTLFSDMYRDCKALGVKDARPLILNSKVSVVDFDNPIDDEEAPTVDEIWSPDVEESDGEEIAGIYTRQYEEVYKSPKKAQLELMYRKGDIPENCYEYMMLTYSQLKDAKKDKTRLDFLTSICEKRRVLFVFDEAHKSSSVTNGKPSVITQCINAILDTSAQTQCVFLSATFAKRPECLITFMQKTVLSSLATSETLQMAFANGGVPMQEYVASKLAREGQMIRREHSGQGIPEPVYTYLDEKLPSHAEHFDKVMYWFREIVKLSDMVKRFLNTASMYGLEVFKAYPTRAQLFYINKILLLSLKARDVAEAAVREVQAGRSVVIGMSDTLECVLRDSIDAETGECRCADFSTILLRLLQKTVSNPKNPLQSVFDLELMDVDDPSELQILLDKIRSFLQTIESGISEEIFHLPMSPIDVIRQLITQETFTDSRGVTRNIRFEECTGRARRLEYLSPEGDDEFINATIEPRKKRHSNHIYNDFQNNKLDVILINACGAIGASAHATATAEVPEEDVRQRKMLIVQNDLDVNIDLQKRGRINRTGQLADLPPLYEYIITAIPSEKRLNMMLRAKLRSLSANTTANQDQDKRQADFIDISNKYGNTVAQDFLAANAELAFVLGLSKTATASQLLARVAMLSVEAQQEIIDEVFASYQNLEQELRRINQWDLEREFRDFEAEFVKEELFSAPIDETAFGGASMLTTFLCRHRTYPYDSATLQKIIDDASREYGASLGDSEKLKKEISEYYRVENKKIRDHAKLRKEKLYATTLQVIVKYGVDEALACQILDMVGQANQSMIDTYVDNFLNGHPKVNNIKRKIESYAIDVADTECRKNRDLDLKTQQRKRLMNILSKAVIGRGYYDIRTYLPVEDSVERIMAVLREVRFGKRADKRFLPGQVKFVFALSAVHKEIVLNIVDKGKQNNYNRLLGILSSKHWEFNNSSRMPKTHAMWDTEIARYNNRILERKIITGNILGAFANSHIAKMKPRFITFTLAKNSDGQPSVERGLLLPLTGENIENIINEVALPIADGLKYANAKNNVYSISGIGIDLSLTPSLSNRELKFNIYIHEKNSRNFEADKRFDTIRHLFTATEITSIHNKGNAKSKRKLVSYSTGNISSQSAEFNDIMTLLASLHAVIMIPRQYLTVGESKKYAKNWQASENTNWPALDWQNTMPMPPVKKEIQIHISPPRAQNADVQYVDEMPYQILLCQRTLDFQDMSLRNWSTITQLRALYLEWHKFSRTLECMSEPKWHSLSYFVGNEIHKILATSSNAPKNATVQFSDYTLRTLKKEVSDVQLSQIGIIKMRYQNEMVFLAPPKDDVQQLLDECLIDPRLEKIRMSLQNYLDGKTEIIIDL